MNKSHLQHCVSERSTVPKEIRQPGFLVVEEIYCSTTDWWYSLPSNKWGHQRYFFEAHYGHAATWFLVPAWMDCVE